MPSPTHLDEPRQFRILYRDFLVRLVDLEIVSSGGDPMDLVVNAAAILSAVSFVFGIIVVNLRSAPRLALWGFEEFLFRVTLVVVGLLTVLAWNALLPERRDSLVLGPLPIRLRTIVVAKSAAIATAVGGAVVAMNVFVGLGYPVVVATPYTLVGVVASVAAYWIAAFSGAFFVFCALLAAQGVLAQMVSYRIFLRISAAMQLAALVLILGSFFVAPPMASPKGLSAPESQRWLQVLPSYWCLGLFEKLMGSPQSFFAVLAGRAVRNTAIAMMVAGVAYFLAWSRSLRRIVEEPDIQPGDRTRTAARLGRALANQFLDRPLDRAIFLFTGRTMARSRQHRLLFAIFGGIGIPFAIASVRSFLMGTYKDRWDLPNAPVAAVGLLLLAIAVGGSRAVFSMPLSLAANWIFKITAVYRPANYFAAVRKSLYLLIVGPVWAISSVFYLAVWPAEPAIEHCLILALAAALLVEGFFYQFRKIPFACSYLPGGSDMKFKIGIYAGLFLIGVSMVSSIEIWALQQPVRVVVIVAALAAWTVRWHRLNKEFDESPFNRVQFEDLPQAEVSPLDLRQDGQWLGDQAWVESIDTTMGRTRWQRVRPFAAGFALLLIGGIIYEQIGEWRDRRRFPQIGKSVNIGARSLNISCIGEGSPTVVFESDQASASVIWSSVQNEVSRFARACWYDRAGYGWSDAGPFPNHADTAARDLHALLAAAGVSPPYILVGDQFGAFHVRVFRGYYPAETAGMVLVEPWNEDTTVSIHNHFEPLRPGVVAFMKTLSLIGLSRFLADPPGKHPGAFTSEEWEEARALLRQPKTLAARVKEPPIWISGELARKAGRFGDLPVVVLTSGIPSDTWYDETYERRVTLNSKLAQLSTRGKQTIVTNSQHRVLFEAPEAIVEAVREVIDEARGKSGADDRT